MITFIASTLLHSWMSRKKKYRYANYFFWMLFSLSIIALGWTNYLYFSIHAYSFNFLMGSLSLLVLAFIVKLSIVLCEARGKMQMLSALNLNELNEMMPVVMRYLPVAMVCVSGIIFLRQIALANKEDKH